MDLYSPSLAYISPNILQGEGNSFGIGCIINDNVHIGSNNYIGQYAVIGTAGEIYGNEQKSDGKVLVGDNNDIREHVTIQASDKGDTVIGSHTMLMTKSHVGHDAVVGDYARLASGAVLGGYGVLGEYARLGLNSVVNPRIIIGEGAIIGSGAVVTKHVHPFSIVAGNPAKTIRFNDKYFELFPDFCMKPELAMITEYKWKRVVSKPQAYPQSNPIIKALMRFYEQIENSPFVRSKKIVE